MRINLNDYDINSFIELLKTAKDNLEIISLYSKYLSFNKNIINRKNINDAKLKYNFDDYYAFYGLFSAMICKTNYFDKYLRDSIKMLNYNKYINNEYYKNIKLNDVMIDNWKITNKYYKSFEPFICGSVVPRDNFMEIPQLGFFNKPFKYPCILEDDNEWMMIVPNEIETMDKPINEVNGKVLVLGLGLGYFPYMISLKDNIKKITIIEKDKELIKLFNKYIFPQFECKDKIEIINGDAFDYLENIDGKYDYVFADIWHDISDGFKLYLKIKKYEKNNGNVKFMYWIYDDLISTFRRYMIVYLAKKISIKYNNKKVEKLISDICEYISYEKDMDKILKCIDKYLVDFNIESIEDIKKIISSEFLGNIVLDI